MNSIQDLIEFARIDTTSAKGKGEEGAKFIRDYMQEHGIEARIIRHRSKNPYVYGEINVGATKTLLIYNHYDVQPAEPLDKWNSDPFDPVIKDGKLVGRGVGDDKGSLMARLQALIEMGKPPMNIKFIYEGEEEIGSPNIDLFLAEHRELLASDYVLWEGAGRGSSGAPTIVLGVKGLLYVEISVRTQKDLHSMYAPVAKNPAWELVYLLSSLKSGGRVNLPGFYDKVKWLTEEERRYLKGNKRSMEDALGQELPDDFQRRLVEEPTCNIAGLYSGYTGEGSKTVIPSYAMAKLDFRLVPDQDPDEILKILQDHLKGVDIKVWGKVRPYRTSINSKIAKSLMDSAKKVYGVDPEVIPNSYGTGPMESFARILQNNQIADGVGVEHPGSNIHSFNENIYVDDYMKAKEWMKSFVRHLAQP
ncbi:MULTISPECIES: M20/M25/M40 family metallo-hydrolase [Metallosphaera]|uniref:Peptidase M20 n=3 Tax=Metallosphaera TaxID=41980 RepID=A4YGT9_METS5|nr:MULTISPECIES: M20/M25/M40 family metallo-hydrolase [Metallosphaera]ABP95641.1 peptidase M20 [Metallosphaera sedula DSM 5348]AIM27625.1 peptidase M20 [Metallosphaera sedula]AKV74482.1 acetylornithine deacetylase [Metallosphaera sedula]AKV76721.1 acetylornithine deacetylase [Metallosphaera sedula]AKV78972.1 acetylornithine deacetylase [Metallosphaera sedula]